MPFQTRGAQARIHCDTGADLGPDRHGICLESGSVRTALNGQLLLDYMPRSGAAPNTGTRVNPAMANSPTAPTTNGHSPCLRIWRRSVRSPTPAKVRRNAHRERFAGSVICALLNSQERRLVGDHSGLTPIRPVECITQHDKADGRITRGLGQHGTLPGRIRVSGARGSCVRGIVHRQSGPHAECVRPYPARAQWRETQTG
jgi:hypothetical protein